MKNAKTGQNIVWHKRHCSVCNHPRCEAIEAAFVAWESPAAIAAEFGLADRSSVYGHVGAFGLLEKRKKNVRVALEKIIERAGEVEVTASAVVAAVQAFAKINTAGEWVDRTDSVNLNQLFERMSAEELDMYAREGRLPAWFRSAVGATTTNARND
jgi:hypothetical protein